MPISKNRLKKIEERVEKIERRNYKYIFDNYEEYEQAKADGMIDPEIHVLILEDLEKEE